MNKIKHFGIGAAVLLMLAVFAQSGIAAPVETPSETINMYYDEVTNTVVIEKDGETYTGEVIGIKDTTNSKEDMPGDDDSTDEIRDSSTNLWYPFPYQPYGHYEDVPSDYDPNDFVPKRIPKQPKIAPPNYDDDIIPDGYLPYGPPLPEEEPVPVDDDETDDPEPSYRDYPRTYKSYSAEDIVLLAFGALCIIILIAGFLVVIGTSAPVAALGALGLAVAMS